MTGEYKNDGQEAGGEMGEENKCCVHTRGERRRTIDNSRANVNQSLVSVRCTIGRYMCLHIPGRKIGHKMNEMGKYACAHRISIVGILITAGMLSSLCVYVCVLLCQCMCLSAVCIVCA